VENALNLTSALLWRSDFEGTFAFSFSLFANTPSSSEWVELLHYTMRLHDLVLN
jgi:hypothetical protein